jgi:hypothetical protein
MKKKIIWVTTRVERVVNVSNLVNTLESFKACDKKAIFESQVAHIWRDITSGDALKSPSKVNIFKKIIDVSSSSPPSPPTP